MSQYTQGSTFAPPPPTVANQYVTDAGTAVPALNILNVLGGANIGTTGAGNTVTINLDNQVLQPDGSQAAPSYSFSSSPSSGIWWDTNTMRLGV